MSIFACLHGAGSSVRPYHPDLPTHHSALTLGRRPVTENWEVLVIDGVENGVLSSS